VGTLTVPFSITTVSDVTLPTAAILFPPPISLTEGLSVLVRGTASDDFKQIKSVQVNGVAATTSDGYANWQATVPLSASTDTDMVVVVQDKAGNVNANAARVKIHQGAHQPAFPAALIFEWFDPSNIELDRYDGRNRLIVPASHIGVGASEAIFTVDLATGARNGIINPSGNSLTTGSVAINPGNKHLYVSVLEDAVSSGPSVMEFDLANLGTVLATHPWQWPDAYADELSALVWCARLNNFAGIDLYSASTFLTPDFNSFSVLSFTGTYPFIVDGLGNEYFKTVNLPDATNPIINYSTNSLVKFIGSMVFDDAHNRFLVSSLLFNNVRRPTLWAIDATTGARSVFSSDAIGGGVPFGSTTADTYMRGMVMDAAHTRVLVSFAGGGVGSIYAIDLNTGSRSVLTSSTWPDSLNQLYDPRGLILDGEQSYVYVVDNHYLAIFAIDLITGERVIVSKAQTGD
jgi:hypothetical protein